MQWSGTNGLYVREVFLQMICVRKVKVFESLIYKGLRPIQKYRYNSEIPIFAN